jgi:hypothetical protein
MRALGRIESFALAFGAALFAFAPTAGATTVVASYDGALPSQRSDYQTGPYQELLVRTDVVAGHYEIVADAGGADGDLAFNLDDDETGPSTVTITVGGGLSFDAVSLEVVNPAESAGEYTISAVGGGGGTMGAPTTAGVTSFPAGFEGIDALVVTQNSPGAFAFDDLTLTVLPEPAALGSLAAAAGLLAWLRRRRAA